MKIVALTSSYPQSADDDSSVFVHRLYTALAAAGHTVTVLAPSVAGKKSDEVRDGVRIIWFSFLPWGHSRLMYRAGIMQNLARAPWLAVEIPFFIAKLALLAAKEGRNADILHANWIPTGIAAALAKLFCGKEFVVTLRGSDAKLLEFSVSRWLSYLGVLSAARITTVSAALGNELCNYFPVLKSKAEVIHNGVELRSDPAADASMPVLPPRFFAAIGSVIPRKSVETLIELLSRPELSGFELVVCGKTEDKSYLSQLRSQVEKLAVKDRVHFLGPISPAVVPAVLKKAAAFFTASVYEGRPNALLEALFCEKIVFASNIPAHREILSDGKNGFLFDAERIAETAVRIASILKNADLIDQISKASKSAVEGHSWRHCAERYSELFRAVIDCRADPIK